MRVCFFQYGKAGERGREILIKSGILSFMILTEEILETVKFLVPPIATLLAGYIGVWYGLRQIRIQKRLAFIEKQLSEFYSPLLGFHKEIRAKSELRSRIQTKGGELWKEQVQAGLNPSIEPTNREIEYNNRQLHEEFLPMYREMLTIFRKGYWLAEPETKKYYENLVEYVEGWTRHEKKGVNPRRPSSKSGTPKKISGISTKNSKRERAF